MNYIHPTAIIYPNVTLGDNNYIGAYSVIGSPPEDKIALKSGTQCGVTIGDNNRIAEYVTISAGVLSDTIIGDDCFIQRSVYIGHDTKISNSVTLSPNCLLGGYCNIADNVNIGMGAMVHQRCTLPYGSMLGMGSVLTKNKNINPCEIWVGNPAKYLKDNPRYKK